MDQWDPGDPPVLGFWCEGIAWCCGLAMVQVASWGGYLLERGILTMSLAPRDNHEAQVQFALERGVPAMLGIISTQRMPYPANSFDMAHCSRCLIPWVEFGEFLVLINQTLFSVLWCVILEQILTCIFLSFVKISNENSFTYRDWRKLLLISGWTLKSLIIRFALTYISEFNLLLVRWCVSLGGRPCAATRRVLGAIRATC